jgi:hypothetical protein
MHCDPLPDWDWVWDWDWVTLGSPKRHPRVAQGPRTDHPRVDLRKCSICNTSWKKGGGWRAERAYRCKRRHRA